MQTIKPTTKRGQSFIDAYNDSRINSLRSCYCKYSKEKAKAENDCLSWMHQENGHNFKIISYCRNFFTCGWITDNGLRIETPTKSYLIN